MQNVFKGNSGFSRLLSQLVILMQMLRDLMFLRAFKCFKGTSVYFMVCSYTLRVIIDN